MMRPRRVAYAWTESDAVSTLDSGSTRLPDGRIDLVELSMDQSLSR